MSSSSTPAASAEMNSQEPSSKKKTVATSNPSIPDDLLVSCLVLVSSLYYPTLSLVSKSLRSLLASPELYQTRPLLGRTESYLYVRLRFPDELNLRWFTLCRKPDHPVLVVRRSQVPIFWCQSHFLNSPPVAVGHNLYAIEEAPCSNHSILDCRTRTCLKAPILRVAHTGSAFDGGIYLAGSCLKSRFSKLYPSVQQKDPNLEACAAEKRINKFGNMEGKIYMNFECIYHVLLVKEAYECLVSYSVFM